MYNVFSVLIVVCMVLPVASFSATKLKMHTSRAASRICMLSDDSRPTTTSSTPETIRKVSPAIALVKKGKKKVLDSLREEIAAAGDAHYINKYLATGEYPFGVMNPPSFHTNTFTKYGTVSIFAEFNKKSKTGFMVGMPPPEIMGGVLRDAGAKSIVVSMDSRSGGALPDEFRRFAVEQAKARIALPGSVPLLWNDLVVDNLQIHQAAALGAAAITLQPDLAPGGLVSAIDECNKFNIEPFVMAKSLEEATEAVDAGARCICLHTLEESELVKMRGQLPNKSKSYRGMRRMTDKSFLLDEESSENTILYSARLRPEENFSAYAEIDQAWVLRDSGFCSVWPSPESIYTMGMLDIYSTILAMRSKASRHFFSPRQFLMDRKMEGAKEYLGDILY